MDLLAGNLNLLVELLPNLVRILLNLNIVAVVVSIYFLVGLFGKGGRYSLMNVRVWLWEQVSVALLIALELLISTIDIWQVCVIFSLVFVFLSNREVLLVVLKLEI